MTGGGFLFFGVRWYSLKFDGKTSHVMVLKKVMIMESALRESFLIILRNFMVSVLNCHSVTT